MLTSETLKAAFDLTSVPMLATTATGKIVLLNAEFEELIGYQTEELKGRAIEVLLPRILREKHTEYVRAFMKVPAKRKMGQGRTLMGLAKSGEEIPLELGLNTVDVNGERHCVLVAVDARVRRSHQRKMELAMEAAAHAMIMVDEDGRIVLANEAALELSGYSEKELASADVDVLVPRRSRTAHRVYRKNYQYTDRRDELKIGRRIHLCHKDGRKIPVEIALTPVETPEGNMVMSTITDLTQRVADEAAMALKNSELASANSKLADANGELMQFAYAVSHDLKAPLASLLGLLNLVDDDLAEDDPKAARDTVLRAKEICERSRTKVERVLRYAREADEEQSAQIDLSKLADEVWQGIAPGAPIATDLICELDIASVTAKPTGVEIVVQNLLDNAVKYHDPRKKKATVRLESRAAKGGLDLIVSDEGVGIPEDESAHVFDMFKRADPRSGDGIGLAMVKKQVTRLGGRISLESEVGRGTSVRVFLPEVEEESGKQCRSR